MPYPTMTVDEIKALEIQVGDGAKAPVFDFAEKNAILWLWTTNGHLRQAYGVLDAWGFEYKAMLTWAKDLPGTGAWLQGQTEHCLLAVRGKPTLLQGGTTLLNARRRAHSQKPEEFYHLIERLCPTPAGSKLELFARQKRAGWAQYGTFEMEVRRAA
jgi:N6-adenosine-specific RNA methylase IME4